MSGSRDPQTTAGAPSSGADSNAETDETALQDKEREILNKLAEKKEELQKIYISIFQTHLDLFQGYTDDGLPIIQDDTLPGLFIDIGLVDNIWLDKKQTILLDSLLKQIDQDNNPEIYTTQPSREWQGHELIGAGLRSKIPFFKQSEILIYEAILYDSNQKLSFSILAYILHCYIVKDTMNKDTIKKIENTIKNIINRLIKHRETSLEKEMEYFKIDKKIIDQIIYFITTPEYYEQQNKLLKEIKSANACRLIELHQQNLPTDLPTDPYRNAMQTLHEAISERLANNKQDPLAIAATTFLQNTEKVVSQNRVSINDMPLLTQAIRHTTLVVQNPNADNIMQLTETNKQLFGINREWGKIVSGALLCFLGVSLIITSGIIAATTFGTATPLGLLGFVLAGHLFAIAASGSIGTLTAGSLFIHRGRKGSIAASEEKVTAIAKKEFAKKH